MDEKLLLNRCIGQLDEGVILANSSGQSSAWYRWAQDAGELLHEIREGRRNAKCAITLPMDDVLHRCTLRLDHEGHHDFGTISNAKK